MRALTRILSREFTSRALQLSMTQEKATRAGQFVALRIVSRIPHRRTAARNLRKIFDPSFTHQEVGKGHQG